MPLFRKYPGLFKFGILLVLLLLIGILVIRNSLFPVFFSLAEARAINNASSIINQIVEEEIERIEYDDLISYEKNNDGQIVLMRPNIREINRFSSQLTLNIKNKLDNLNELTIEIPVMRILGFDMLAGFGPDIEVKILPVGFIKPPEINDSFESAGINQVRHKIYLHTDVKLRMIVPFSSETTSVRANLPITEVTMLGEVPEIYVEIDGEGITKSGIISDE